MINIFHHQIQILNILELQNSQKMGQKLLKNFLEKFEKEKSLEGDVSRVFEEIIKNKYEIHANFTDNLVWFNVNTSYLFKKAKKYFENKNSDIFHY